MAPTLRQSAANSVAKYVSQTCKATFQGATSPGSLVLAVVVGGGRIQVTQTLSDNSFTLLKSYTVRDLQLSVWYRENCPSITTLSVSSDAPQSLQIRLLEYTGVSQSGALDKFTFQASELDSTDSGPSGTLSQADSLVLGIVANQYASTAQYGFFGGLTKLFESTSPSGFNEDWERARFTVHSATPSTITTWRLQGILSSTRRWISFLICFKGGSSGPVRLSSTQRAKPTTMACRGSLSAFGPLASVLSSMTPQAVFESSTARIGPFNYQYRLGGWSGLLIGHDTDYRVEELDGLEGWDMRTSDADLPRGDGALRGVDLQSARLPSFKINFDGTQAEIETALDILYRTLIPQRDSDWQLIYRHPGRPLRYISCRPTQLIRQMSVDQLLVHNQTFVLRAADPRHYSVIQSNVTIPVSPTTIDDPITTNAINLGNAPAYPLIRVTIPPTIPLVTRVELVNSTADTVFDIRASMTARSVLLGDMSSRVTGQPVSVVTIDGQSKYGAWQFPREAFRLNPGANALYMRTEPANLPVSCVLSYQDTWSG